LKFIPVILFILLVNVQYHLWFGKGSYETLQVLQNSIKQQQQENAALKARNETLAAEVDDLKQGLDAIEARARKELGMIKPGEVFYEIVE
jgi:cell division protein FtsB